MWSDDTLGIVKVVGLRQTIAVCLRIHEPYIATMPAVATRGGRVRKGRLGSLIAALRE